MSSINLSDENRLRYQLECEIKTKEALLKRVKNFLKYQSNANEIFEKNAYLEEQVRETRKKLYEQMEATQKLNYLAKHDALTGLTNRNSFEERLKHIVNTAKKYESEHVVCFLDLDQFKVVNDTAGHIAGDELLRQLAMVIKNDFRNTDEVSRLGGDEFGIIFENCALDIATVKIQKVLEKVENFRFFWEDKSFRVSASIGIVVVNSQVTNANDVLKCADIACYSAKSKGRNRFEVYQPDNSKNILGEGELSWVPRINNALDNDNFVLFFQRIVHSHQDNQNEYCEILLRMKDSEGKLIAPGAFLPAAERYGLIAKIDLWVVEKLLFWIDKNAHSLPKSIRFSLNVSGDTLGNTKILATMLDMVRQSGLRHESLCFEITETTAISNLETANWFIDEVRSLGCQVALDDFGSGLSSFGHLKTLKVDVVKIDGIFVRDIVDDPIDAAMVEAINKVAHLMQLKTVAEYVENEAIAIMLSEMGVDYLQGYGIHKPEPLDKLIVS